MEKYSAPVGQPSPTQTAFSGGLIKALKTVDDALTSLEHSYNIFRVRKVKTHGQYCQRDTLDLSNDGKVCRE